MNLVPDASHSLRRLEGDGNRFLLVDHLAGQSVEDPSGHARRVCEDDPFEPDGVLHLDRDAGGQLRMVLFNRDGSRPETCGNGLRCLAWHAVVAGYETCGTFDLVTDAGPAPARVTRTRQGDLQVQVALGPVRIVEHVELGSSLPEAVWVDCGNPHLVVPGMALDEERAGMSLAEWGPKLSCDPRFPDGINVEFVSLGPEGISARVWERGVGETGACGSGACAVARVAVHRGDAKWPVTVRLPGGVLTLSPCDPGDLIWMQGSVRGEDRTTP